MNLAALSIKRPTFITCIIIAMLIVGYLAFKRLGVDLFPNITFPVVTSNIPRQIPELPWYAGSTFVCMLGGILPFGACFVEMFFIMSSI
ncbi:MAG: efflux RND transporter permease subunit, partial [Oligoflexus sp.]